MKILAITSLYPNSAQPASWIFNKQQLTALSKFAELEIVAPIPWSPSIRINEKWRKFSMIPREESVEGVKIHHPRYFIIPKFARSFYGLLYYSGVIRTVRQIYRTFKFDAILATWAYPDGFAASLIAKVMKKPFVIKVHGSDMRLPTRYFIRRKMIQYAFSKAKKIIAVSGELKNRITELGAAKEKVEVIPNGIDSGLFRPIDADYCRKKLNLSSDSKIVTFIGNLEPVKGPDVLLEAIYKTVDNHRFLVIGNGPLRKALKKKIADLKLEDSVMLIPAKPHSEIPLWMNASDVFCLPSRNEGCPNVVLEALSCGIPVVASRTGGIPDIIRDGENGILTEAGDSVSLGLGIKKAISKTWDRNAIRNSVSGYTWHDNAKRLFDIVESVMETGNRINILYHHRTQGTGAEGVHIAGIIKGLRKLGHNVYVISPPGVNPERAAGSNPYEKKRVLINRILNFISRRAPQFLFEILEIGYNFRAHGKISALIKKHKIDFIYERHSFFSFAAARLAAKSKIPVFVEVNELAGEKRIRKQSFTGLAKKAEMYVFRNADAIFVVSEFLKRKIMELGIDGKKIMVVPNAVDPERFTPLSVKKGLRKKYGIGEEGVIIGFIGWFVYWHNIELLIDVFADISKKRNAFLLLIGDGVLKDKFHAMVKEKGIEDRVIFTGAVSHELIPAYIDLMDISVIPDSNEYRSPIKLFEYMAMGKPVIAPRLEPLEYVIKDGENGVLFRRGDRKEFEEALDMLIEDVAVRAKMGLEAKETVLRNHTWVSNAKMVTDMLAEVTK